MKIGEGKAARAPALAAVLFMLLAPAALPASAEFSPFNSASAAAPEINFCASGKFVIVSGSCAPGPKLKEVITPNTCAEAANLLYEGLSYLYPNATVEVYRDPGPDEVMAKLMRPLVLGFFFIGEGDVKGGFLTGERQALYPDLSGCMSGALDLYAGFTSHSKYSPDYAARKEDRGQVLSRSQVLYGGAGAAPGSWPKLCKPRLSLVYSTRTFAGRLRSDVKKFIGILQDEKARHVLKTLGTICDNCKGHLELGDDLSRLCPPNSDVCKLRKVLPGTEEFILKNYCGALAPTPSRQ